MLEILHRNGVKAFNEPALPNPLIGMTALKVYCEGEGTPKRFLAEAVTSQQLAQLESLTKNRDLPFYAACINSLQPTKGSTRCGPLLLYDEDAPASLPIPITMTCSSENLLLRMSVSSSTESTSRREHFRGADQWIGSICTGYLYTHGRYWAWCSSKYSNANTSDGSVP